MDSEPAGRIVDLTLAIHPGMPVYPGDPEVRFEPVSHASPAGEFAVTRIALGTHAGTHVDAPAHALPGGRTVDALPLDACVGPARIVDCTGLAAITLPDLRRRLAHPQPGERILIRTDWGIQHGTGAYFEGFPGLTLPAVRWLAGCHIALLGLETPSLCPTSEHAAHAALLGAGVVVIEGLARLRDVGAGECWLAALPLPLAGLDGAPARVVAWVGPCGAVPK